MARFSVKRAGELALPVALFGAGTVLVAASAHARAGAVQALTLCGNTVVPALFPFFCLCEWWVRTGAAETLTRWLAPVFRLLLGPLWQGGAALLLGLLGGYPMGAAAAGRLQARGVLSQNQARRLCLAVFGPSPAFAVTAVGAAWLGSRSAGLLLWGGNCMATLAMVAALRVLFSRQPAPQPSVAVQSPTGGANAFVEGVAAACRVCFTVCGLVVLFGAVNGVFTAWHLPAAFTRLAAGAGEVTYGAQTAVQAGASLPLLAAVLAFGGLCTHCQIYAVAGKNAPSYWLYLPVRLAQSGLAYAATRWLCRLFPGAVPTAAVSPAPALRTVSPLPAAAVLAACGVFLVWFHFSSGRNIDEKSGLYYVGLSQGLWSLRDRQPEF